MTYASEVDTEALDFNGSPVVAEVEVVFFNLLKARGLVVGALAKGDGRRRTLLRGPVAPMEQPSATARRLLETVAGVTTAVHEPEFVSARVSAHRQAERPTLTLTYVVMGSRPSDSALSWMFFEGVDDLDPPLDMRVDDADAVRAARHVAARLLEELPVAPALLCRPGQPFTLADLHWAYSSIIGPQFRTNVANFRRKVERVPGLVTRAPAHQSGQTEQSKRGRRPTWYTHGNAETINPSFGSE